MDLMTDLALPVAARDRTGVELGDPSVVVFAIAQPFNCHLGSIPTNICVD